LREPLFLILGHGHSGTMYMARLMQYFCYDVQHERCGANGISDSLAMWNARGGSVRRAFENRGKKGVRPCYLIQVVRNPWRVVCTDFGIPHEGGSANYAKRWPAGVSEPGGIERPIRTVVVYNRKVSELGPDLVVHVESAPREVERWLRMRGLYVGHTGELPPTDVNTKPGERSFSFDSVAPELMREFREHCRIYGYEETPPR